MTKSKKHHTVSREAHKYTSEFTLTLENRAAVDRTNTESARQQGNKAKPKANGRNLEPKTSTQSILSVQWKNVDIEQLVIEFRILGCDWRAEVDWTDTESARQKGNKAKPKVIYTTNSFSTAKNADVDQMAIHLWQRNSCLKGYTEGFIPAPQDWILFIGYYQSNIMHNSMDWIFRLYDQCIQTIIDHLFSQCSILWPSEYKISHIRVGQYLNWKISHNYGIKTAANWCEVILNL